MPHGGNRRIAGVSRSARQPFAHADKSVMSASVSCFSDVGRRADTVGGDGDDELACGRTRSPPVSRASPPPLAPWNVKGCSAVQTSRWQPDWRREARTFSPCFPKGKFFTEFSSVGHRTSSVSTHESKDRR